MKHAQYVPIEMNNIGNTFFEFQFSLLISCLLVCILLA